MPRIRSVKPEVHGDGTSGRLSDTAFRLLIGLLNFADDVGVNLLDVGEIHARVFPYKKSERGTESALEELRESGMSQHFTLGNGKSYVYIVNFLKHQKIDRPSQPMIPGWEVDWTLDQFLESIGQPGLFDEGSPTTRRTLDEGSEQKGKDRKGVEIRPSSVIDSLPEHEQAKLIKYCGGPNILCDILEELDDYVLSSGKKYKDIPATVRSWYRRKRNEGKLPAAPKQSDPGPQGPKEKPPWTPPPKVVTDLTKGIGKDFPGEDDDDG